MLVSYAQNGEDVVLRRVLGAKSSGFYIDVGACWPDNGSVTKAFYDAGWSGINIEPHPRTFSALKKQRSRDTNLQIALSSKEGKGVLFEGPSEGESPTVGGGGGGHFNIDVWTLQKVCDLFVAKQIDFLKIDVEGDELEVLRGGDFVNYRPAVIICEVTKAWSNIKRKSANEIDSFLAEQGYRSVYFDGLNAYYAAQERADLLSATWVQPNPIDRFVTSREAELGVQAEANAQEIARLAALIKTLEADRQAAAGEVARMATQHASREAELGAQAEANVQEIARLHRVVLEQSTWGEASVRHVNQLMRELSSLRKSTSWRLTRPLRGIVYILKGGLSAIRRLPGRVVRRTARVVRLRAPGLYLKLATTRSVRRLYKPFSIPFPSSHLPAALPAASGPQHITPAACPKLTELHVENYTTDVEAVTWSKSADLEPKLLEAGLLAALAQTPTGRRIHA